MFLWCPTGGAVVVIVVVIVIASVVMCEKKNSHVLSRFSFSNDVRADGGVRDPACNAAARR